MTPLILAFHTLDHAHLGVTALLWAAGLVYIISTLPKVSSVRRVMYGLAIPLWIGFLAIYIVAFLTYDGLTGVSAVAAVLRGLLFGIALEGLIAPMTDRLELKSQVHEIRIQGTPNEGEDA